MGFRDEEPLEVLASYEASEHVFQAVVALIISQDGAFQSAQVTIDGKVQSHFGGDTEKHRADAVESAKRLAGHADDLHSYTGVKWYECPEDCERCKEEAEWATDTLEPP